MANQDDLADECEKSSLQDLHLSIEACDDMLMSVETYLSAFHTDLGVVSAEIESLQNRSAALNKRLENRKNVERLLGPIIEDVIIPPHEVRQIVEGDINDAWVQTLHKTDRRMKIVKSKDPSRLKAIQEIKPELKKLVNKAVERMRDFFVLQIKGLRIPGVSVRAIQHDGFLQYKELLQFLANYHAPLADEIGQAYINTMRWYYSSHFQRYLKTLEKLKLHTVDKTDTLGQEESSRKSTDNFISSTAARFN